MLRDVCALESSEAEEVLRGASLCWTGAFSFSSSLGPVGGPGCGPISVGPGPYGDDGTVVPIDSCGPPSVGPGLLL